MIYAALWRDVIKPTQSSMLQCETESRSTQKVDLPGNTTVTRTHHRTNRLPKALRVLVQASRSFDPNSRGTLADLKMAEQPIEAVPRVCPC